MNETRDVPHDRRLIGAGDRPGRETAWHRGRLSTALGVIELYMSPIGGLVPPAPFSGDRGTGAISKGHFSGSLIFGDEDGEGAVLEVESHLEMQVALILRARPGVVHLATQVAFKWVDATGKVRTHNFDFKVYHADGSRTAVMVKPEHRRRSAGFISEARHIAAKVTPDFAERVCVFTENSLEPVELHNATLLHAWRRPDPEADAAARRVTADLPGAVRLQDLIARIGIGPRGLHALVRLIGIGRLQLVDHVRIDGDAMVTGGRG